MDENKSSDSIKRSKMIRTLAIIALAGATLVIVLSVFVFPKMKSVFLRKGIEYAAEKTVATLPAVEGFNPKIHKHDPLEVKASFDAIHAALLSDSLLTEDFLDSASAFMKLFKNCYDDQVIVPDEQTTIVNGLDDLQRWILRKHFNKIKQPLLFILTENFKNDLPPSIFEILGFDSIAIYNDEIQLGMTGPLSLNLVVAYYNSIKNKTISQEDAENIVKIISDIERFQIKNELKGLTKLIYKTEEFKAFSDRKQFQEDVDFIINRLRDQDYDYTPIKATLRSIIVLWYDQENTEESEKNRIEQLYDFLIYTKNRAMIKEKQTPESLEQPDTLSG